jgi:hypothetical protein
LILVDYKTEFSENQIYYGRGYFGFPRVYQKSVSRLKALPAAGRLELRPVGL